MNSQQSLLIDLQVRYSLIKFWGSEFSIFIAFVLISEDPLLRLPSTVNAYAIWNTTAGQNSLPSTVGLGIGNYYYNQYARNVFDGNWTTAICLNGVGNASALTTTAGLNTGVYLTIPGDPFFLKAFRFVTTSSLELNRDPLKLTIEGSNLIGTALTLGSSWTLIYNDTTGLDTNPGRTQPGIRQTLNNNASAFSSYRFLFTQRRGASAYCMEFVEIELYLF